jgi:hypothetical protein
MIIGKIEIIGSRWPWQAGYNWRGMITSPALFNAGGARFGAGWKYKLGISVGSSTLMIDLIFGIISFRKAKKK